MNKMYHVWKTEGGEVEWEPAYLDDIAKWLSEGYGVYLDEELTKDARDLDFGWISITKEYIEACEDEDVMFMPDRWNVVDSEEDTTNLYEPAVRLTAEGRVLAKEWMSDYSRGYDLCTGKGYGLALLYKSEDIWNLICSNEEYHK